MIGWISGRNSGSCGDGRPRPSGRAELGRGFGRPYGTRLGFVGPDPALKRRAILGRPYGTRLGFAGADPALKRRAILGRPCGTRLGFVGPDPALKRRAILGRPCGTRLGFVGADPALERRAILDRPSGTRPSAAKDGKREIVPTRHSAPRWQSTQLAGF